MKGKLIVIEGTDCSGKETQTKLLMEKLNKVGIRCERFSFPCYDTPTGKIIGGPYLGKSYICESWFKEGAINVDPKVISLYYAADRKYNIKPIIELLENGVNVILDRYVYSNMAHQASKIKDKEERFEMYKWLEKLEFEFLELPKLDIGIFLHMPLEVSKILKEGREEKLDEHEKQSDYLKDSENAYIEISDLYGFKTIECNDGKNPRTIEKINEELYNYVISKVK